MVGTEKQVVIRQPGDQRFKIVTAALKLDVVALGNVIDADVQLISAGQGAGDFLAEEEIGAGTQGFHGVDGIVIGDRYQVHAEAFQLVVDGERIVVAFPADGAKAGDGAHAGVPGVDVEIAPHMRVVTPTLSQGRDSA